MEIVLIKAIDIYTNFQVAKISQGLILSYLIQEFSRVNPRGFYFHVLVLILLLQQAPFPFDFTSALRFFH